jgi:hypothetical protein
MMDKITEDKMEMINDTDIIVIDDGEVFEGTKAQFADCFFSNVTYENIKEWCKESGFKFKLRKYDDTIIAEHQCKNIKSVILGG